MAINPNSSNLSKPPNIKPNCAITVHQNITKKPQTISFLASKRITTRSQKLHKTYTLCYIYLIKSRAIQSQCNNDGIMAVSMQMKIVPA